MHTKKKKELKQKFIGMTIPCIIGMLLTSSITVVDGVFIGAAVGPAGLASMNLMLPLLYLMLGLTIMTGVGGMTLALQKLGKGDSEGANETFSITLVMNLIINSVAALALRAWLPTVIGFLGAKGEMAVLLSQYLRIMLLFYPFMMVNITLAMFVRGEGRPALSLSFGLVGNLINLALDYVLIIRMEGGMEGAALASGISVLIPCLLGSGYFLTGRSTFQFCWTKPNWRAIAGMLFNGSSEFVSQISVSITTGLVNWVMLAYLGVHGVAAMTIVGYVAFLESMVILGICQGGHPIISYSYGSSDGDAVRAVTGMVIKGTFLTGVVFFGVVMVAAPHIAILFASADSQLATIAAEGMRWYGYSFLLGGVNSAASMYFTALGGSFRSAVISGLRGLVLISLFVILLPRIMGAKGVWLAAPLTETCTFLLSGFWMVQSMNRLVMRNSDMLD